MSEATCKTCPWWHQCNGFPDGTCRAHAPVVIALSRADALPTVILEPHTVWPLTQPDGSCGEHPDRKHPEAGRMHELLERIVDESGQDVIGNYCVSVKTLAEAEELLARMEESDG